MVSGWGKGWNPTGTMWDFETTGQLGDSFGVLSATMAGIAAYFAFRTYRSARDDSAMLERRAAEPSYLNLLERRYDVLDRVRYIKVEPTTNPDDDEPFSRKEWRGHDAVDALAAHFDFVVRMTKDDVGLSFEEEMKDTFGLTNLYRFTYHIVSFADRQMSLIQSDDPMEKTDPAYQYVRLLRAQMSDSELLLVALNCAYSEGREKFKPLVERYALLHNMNPNHISIFGLGDLFEPTAFGVLSADRGLATDQPAISPDPGA